MGVRLVSENGRLADTEKEGLLGAARNVRIAASYLAMSLDSLGRDLNPHRMKIRFAIGDAAGELGLVLEAISRAVLAEADRTFVIGHQLSDAGPHTSPSKPG